MTAAAKPINRADTGPCFNPVSPNAAANPCPRCKGAGHVLLEVFQTGRAKYSRALICCLCGGAGVEKAMAANG